MPTLAYNCPAGISGDMNLGAMVGLGVDPAALEAELRKLPYQGWHLHFDPDQRGGISGLRCTVHLEADHTHEDGHTHGHEHTHEHDHGHTHSHEHHHRTFANIRDAIASSQLSVRVKADATACFYVLAQAEGAVHGIAPEEVHFHEVGAIDSIVDMVGAAICWDILGVDRIVCQNLEVGGGTVQCAHGRMPVPAPATARLLEGKPYSAGGTNKETTTPTGAALLVGSDCEFGASTQGIQLKTAIGVGQRDDPNLPNVVYVSLIDESATQSLHSDTVWELAVNLDDMTGEAIAFLCEQIRSSGAVDCWQVPAYFKKGRPGTIVHCLCTETERTKIESAIFKHSRSLGIRRQQWQRSKLLREEQHLQTEHGEVRVKSSQKLDGTMYRKFEYEDCARIARETGKSLDDVQKILNALKS